MKFVMLDAVQHYAVDKLKHDRRLFRAAMVWISIIYSEEPNW
jgi:hypothetical protein